MNITPQRDGIFLFRLPFKTGGKLLQLFLHFYQFAKPQYLKKVSEVGKRDLRWEMFKRAH